LFGELPKLFDRDFAIAYFLPSAAFSAVTYWIVLKFNLAHVVFAFSAESFLKDIASFGLVSLFGGIILLIANRGILRLFEGYWPLRMGQRLNWIERRHFRKLQRENAESDSQIESYELRGLPFPRELQEKRNKIKFLLPRRVPHSEHLVLPTSFGNTYRAFEAYSFIMYGIDSIPGWYRLLAVIPKEYRGLIDSAKAPLNFWVNACFLSLLAIVEFYLAATVAGAISWRGLVSPHARFPWIPLFAFLSFLLSYSFARRAAEEWGNWVKSAFDLYLPDLRTKLGFPPAASKQEEFTTWTNFSVAVLTRSAELMKSIQEPDSPSPIQSRVRHKLYRRYSRTFFGSRKRIRGRLNKKNI